MQLLVRDTGGEVPRLGAATCACLLCSQGPKGIAACHEVRLAAALSAVAAGAAAGAATKSCLLSGAALGSATCTACSAAASGASADCSAAGSLLGASTQQLEL